MAKAKREVTAESAVRRDLRTPLTSKQRGAPETLERLQSSKLKAKGLEFEQYADARHLKFVHGKGVPKSQIHKIYK
jgi:hypothetical protein